VTLQDTVGNGVPQEEEFVPLFQRGARQGRDLTEVFRTSFAGSNPVSRSIL
jgi:hypothetical protein